MNKRPNNNAVTYNRGHIVKKLPVRMVAGFAAFCTVFGLILPAYALDTEQSSGFTATPAMRSGNPHFLACSITAWDIMF